MKSETPSRNPFLQSQNPVAVALHHAVLTTARVVDPEKLDFQSEIDSRLQMVRGCVDLIAKVTGDADSHDDSLSVEGLHCMARLISNELTTISILHEFLQRALEAEVQP